MVGFGLYQYDVVKIYAYKVELTETSAAFANLVSPKFEKFFAS